MHKFSWLILESDCQRTSRIHHQSIYDKNKINGTLYKNEIAFGFVLLLIFTITIPVDAQIESPKKQMKRGVSAEEVICKEGLNLIIRNNGEPACVKPSTAEVFQERGMAFVPIKVTDVKPESKAATPQRTVQFKDAQDEITNIPASGGSIVNFYITDDDLNLAHSGVELIETEGLVEFLINGIPIPGPERMIETGPDTGVFYARLQLPETINGVPVDQDDIVEVRYLDESDASGEPRVLVKSIPLKSTFAQIETSADKTRIGHHFTIRLYEPDANRDSKDEDRIRLDILEFRAEGGIRTTLANPKFDANSSFLIETGPNSNVFQVIIKIPRTIDGKTIHIGDWYEIRYIDRTTPSETDEKIILKGRIG